ncbi:hypothetical protein LVJ94_26580 [Pendulispora rubella]|uniref:Zinc-finger domain-containing protein n=1 Tax=Pendulispora rubella TaxID=2741070 RepID=A0ABZ2KVZ4_9BACT
MTAIDDQPHMSTFTIDAYYANGCRGDPSLAGHLETCARCRGYLAALDASKLAGAPTRAQSAPAKTGPRLRRILSISAGTIALAAGVAGVVRSVNGDEKGYVASKGTPAAQALIRSEGRSRIWDGRSPVHARDAIALRAGCEGFTHVAVIAPSADGWSRLFDGACPSGSTPLPFTLVVDDAPGEERVSVVFSAARLDDGVLRDAARHRDRTKKAWIVEFVFPKVITP